MKNIILVAMLASFMSGCASTPDNAHPQPNLGMANPASAFCIEQRGTLEIRREAHGEVGYCHLASGEVVEEWAYFRSQQQQCLPEAAKSLVGKTLTDAEIQHITQAKTVRRVKPGQPVTMDYQSDRVTVTLDPDSHQITQANCG